MKIYTNTFTTPLGAFSVAVDETGALLATAFGDLPALRQRLIVCHVLRDKSPAADASELVRDPWRTRDVGEQLAAYFAGTLHDFTLHLAPPGTDFQHRVWATLRAIPYGQTRSYAQLARALGSAPRAVGRANATNPICLIVPCHRVIGADGSLTGFAFGEDTKRRLLAHEGALAAVAA